MRILEPFLKRPAMFIVFAIALLFSFFALFAQQTTYTSFGGVFLRPSQIDWIFLITSPLILLSFFLYAVGSCGMAALIRAMRSNSAFVLKPSWVVYLFVFEVIYVLLLLALYPILSTISPQFFAMVAFLIGVPFFFLPVSLVFEGNLRWAIRKSIRAIMLLPIPFVELLVLGVLLLGITELLSLANLTVGMLFLGMVVIPLMMSLQSHLYLKLYPIIP